MGNSYKRISSVKKAFKILEFLSEQDGPVTEGEIIRALSLRRATLKSYLATLMDERFIAQVGDKYELGPQFPEIWARYRKKLQAKINEKGSELDNLEVPDVR